VVGFSNLAATRSGGGFRRFWLSCLRYLLRPLARRLHPARSLRGRFICFVPADSQNSQGFLARVLAPSSRSDYNCWREESYVLLAAAGRRLPAEENPLRQTEYAELAGAVRASLAMEIKGPRGSGQE
jgi:hypothetical protein